MKTLLTIVFCLFAGVAQAQTTVETAIMWPSLRTPKADGTVRIDDMPLVKIAYGTCAERTAEALAAFYAREDELAALYGRTGWIHASRVRCYQERFEVEMNLDVSTEENSCLLVFSEPFDWFAPCP